MLIDLGTNWIISVCANTELMNFAPASAHPWDRPRGTLWMCAAYWIVHLKCYHFRIHLFFLSQPHYDVWAEGLCHVNCLQITVTFKWHRVTTVLPTVNVLFMVLCSTYWPHSQAAESWTQVASSHLFVLKSCVQQWHTGNEIMTQIFVLLV